MTQKQKRQLIDKINDAFISFMRDFRGTRYIEYFKRINNQIIEREGLITEREIRTIVEQETNDLNLEDFAIFSLLIGSITAIIENQRMSKRQRENLLPIVTVASIYSLSSPNTFVRKVYQSYKKPKSKNELRVQKLIKQHIQDNKVVVETIKTKQKEMLIRSQTQAKLAQSKRVIDDVVKLTEEGKPLEMQRIWLKRKYNNNKVMERALDTEIHANIELGKQEQARTDGFTKKTWRTQGDSKVRKTVWHNKVANMTVPIDEDFIVGTMRASHAGDERLPVGERIRCRCYIVYS